MSQSRIERAGVPPIGRLASLDGLRGLASVVVVFYHALLTVPVLGLVAYGYPPVAGSKAWFATYTPLHVVWLGTESVYLFFVLSGLVLVIQARKNPRFAAWVAYYPRRALRLYLPIWGAIAFAFITIALVPRTRFAGESLWLQLSATSYSGGAIHQDMMMVLGQSNTVTPFWSLYWEILFSLALPLYVLFAGIGHRYLFWPKLAIVFAVLVYGASGGGGDFYFYLSMFGFGALFAAHWSWLGSAFAKVSGKHWFWWPYLVVALGLMTFQWLLLGVRYDIALASSLKWVPVIGAGMLVLGAGFWPGMRRLFELRLFQWLGVVSFSLYLVHEPIVKAMQYLFAGQGGFLTLPVSIGVSFLIATLFSRFVELPAHRLSQRVGRGIIALFPAPKAGEGAADKSTPKAGPADSAPRHSALPIAEVEAPQTTPLA